MPYADPRKGRARSHAYYQENKERIRSINTIYRSQEMLIIAQANGDDTPRCRADLTPELLDVPCRGKLQIDHINGDGSSEQRGTGRTWKVVHGGRELNDLRVLCELHQWYYAIKRGDTIGGSDPGEWSE